MKRPDTQRALASLKDFQHDTVDYDACPDDGVDDARAIRIVHMERDVHMGE